MLGDLTNIKTKAIASPIKKVIGLILKNKANMIKSATTNQHSTQVCTLISNQTQYDIKAPATSAKIKPEQRAERIFLRLNIISPLSIIQWLATYQKASVLKPHGP